MDVTEALAREASWRQNPQLRPQAETARAVAAALADRVKELEEQLIRTQRLAVGRQVIIHRGNPGRGTETGPGFGRKVPAVIVDPAVGPHQVRCQLLNDDPDAVGAPNRAGDVGLWCASQIATE